MSMCDNCIHDEVCGLEDNHEEAITFCADMMPKNVLEDIKAEIKQLPYQSMFGNVSNYSLLDVVVEIIDKHIGKGDEWEKK